MKLRLILAMLIPTMRLAVQFLREKDENTTGFDDIAADHLDTAINAVERYANSPESK
jgi:hypothetical protein